MSYRICLQQRGRTPSSQVIREKRLGVNLILACRDLLTYKLYPTTAVKEYRQLTKAYDHILILE
jgi:hypothetical protein